MTLVDAVQLLVSGGGLVGFYQLICFRLKRLECKFDNGINRKIDTLTEHVARLEERCNATHKRANHT